MSVAQPPASRPIEFRDATLGATVAILRIVEPHLLADALHKMLGGMPDFFSGEAAILDFAELEATPAHIDWAGLLSLMRRFQLQPVGIRNLDPELAATARKAGLSILDRADLQDRATAAPPPAAAPSPPPRPAAAASSAPPRPAPAAVSEAAPARASTLIIERPVRSGQQVYARGADLVLLAGMSNGAEVIADGSIHCYGPLRGRALAGAQGDGAARIITTNFGPEIVSIAGIYKTFEDGVAASLAGLPAHVRLTDDGRGQRLGIEPLQLD